MRYVNSSYRSGLLAKFRLCAYAPMVIAFNHSLEEFIKSGRKVTLAFLKDLPLEYWSNVFFGDSHYSEMTSNAVESFNSWIRDARHLPITQMIDSIRTQIMQQMAKRRRKVGA
ncbi:hypothetical protein ACSBR1_005653 [Camellia fascicularis]